MIASWKCAPTGAMRHSHNASAPRERHAVEDVVERLGGRIDLAWVGAGFPVRHGQRLAGLIISDGVHFCVELNSIAHDWHERFGHTTEAAFDGAPLVG